MYQMFIGIDPSINSTGICIQVYKNDLKEYESFFIVKPDKLTKKEQKISCELENLNYIIYSKYDLSEYKEDNHLYEYYKTLNMISIIETICNIIVIEIEKYINSNINIYIIMEGISYGSSTRTKSVFDLAGLNYLIRYKIINIFNNCKLTIIPPSELKKFITGKGNSNKETICDLFLLLNPNFINIPKIDDIADAYYMTLYGAFNHKK